MESVFREFMDRGFQLPNRAAAELARTLMKDDPDSHKAGYTLGNAVAAACEVFPQAEPEAVLRLVEPMEVKP